MSATLQRDHVSTLARNNPGKALDLARKVNEPWFRAQALSWVARFTDGDPLAITLEAAKTAGECDDDYKRAAVRAWEIAALAERGFAPEARKRLGEAVRLARCVMPVSSRSEALLLLMQAALKISLQDASQINEILNTSCTPGDHWRCKRALKDGQGMISGELQPRPFFW